MNKLSVKNFLIVLLFFKISSISISQNYQNVDSIISLISQSDDSTKIIFYKEIAWNYRNNEPFKSIIYGKKALALADALKDSNQIASVYNFLGVFERKMNKYADAINYNLKALNVAIHINNKIEIAYAYNNIGEIHSLQNNNSLAYTNLHKALNAFKEIKNLRGIAYSYEMLGELSVNQKKYDQAMAYFIESIAISKRRNKPEAMATSYRYIGKIFSLQNKYKDAIVYYLKSLEISENYGQLKRMAETYISLGSVYIDLGKYDIAMLYYLDALKIGITIHAVDNQSDASYGLSKVYQLLNDYRNAFKYLDIHKELNDSLNRYENTKIITQISMQHEFDKEQREKKIEQQKKEMVAGAELKKQKRIRHSVSVGFVIVLLLAVYAYRNSKKIKKANVLLMVKNMQINEQKEEIHAQKDEIEVHLEEVTKQRDQIIKQKKQITDSIEYAERIQSAILPSDEIFKKNFQDHFILFRPKDIVSGDFYWAANKDEYFYFAVADCTGHGVPGAIMSMLGTAFLNDIVNQSNLKKANLILEKLRENIKSALKQTGYIDGSKDGMDMALCIINKKTKELQFAGANRPAYIFRKHEIKRLAFTENPIGIYFREFSFQNQIIKLNKNDKIYLFTDGYADQFGVSENKKYMILQLINLIKKIHEKPMAQQKMILNKTLDDWMNHIKPSGENFKQVDDILVLGVTI